MMPLRTISRRVSIIRLRATGPGRIHPAAIEAAIIATRKLSTRLRPALRGRTKLTRPILRLRPAREVAEVLRPTITPSVAESIHTRPHRIRPLRATLEVRLALHPRSTRIKLRAILGKAASPLRTKRTTPEIRSTLHPRTLRTKLRTIPSEAAPLLRSKRPTMMVVVHPRASRTKLRSILCEALASLPRAKTMVMMAVLHSRFAPIVLRKLLPRSRPHRPITTIPRPGLRPRILRAVVLPLPLLASAVKALRHLLSTLHLTAITLAHLALETLPHLLLSLRTALHPGLRSAIAVLPSLRRSTRSAGLRARTLRACITPIIAARWPLAITIKRRPAIPIAAPITTPIASVAASIATRLIGTEVPAPRRTHLTVTIAPLLIGAKIAATLRTHLAIALAARLPRLIRPRLRLARLLRIAILRTPHEAPIELREKLIRRDAPIAAAIELLQHLRRILHLLLIDHTIVIRIEQIEERRPHPAPIARATTATLPIRARLAIRPLPIAIRPLPVAIAITRQALRRIRRLGRLRGLWRRVLRAEHRCRERHRDRGK
jgi:hypothetical protein